MGRPELSLAARSPPRGQWAVFCIRAGDAYLKDGYVGLSAGVFCRIMILGLKDRVGQKVGADSGAESGISVLSNVGDVVLQSSLFLVNE